MVIDSEEKRPQEGRDEEAAVDNKTSQGGNEVVSDDSAAVDHDSTVGDDTTVGNSSSTGVNTELRDDSADCKTNLKAVQVKETEKSDNDNNFEQHLDPKEIEKVQTKLDECGDTQSAKYNLVNIPTESGDDKKGIQNESSELNTIDNERISNINAVDEHIEKSVVHSTYEEESSKIETDANMDSMESDTGDSQDTTAMVTLLLDSMAKSDQTVRKEIEQSICDQNITQSDNTASTEPTALNPEIGHTFKTKSKTETIKSKIESNVESTSLSERNSLATDQDGNIVKSTERAYEVLAMWNKISETADTGSEVLCDLIAQKIEDGKKHDKIETANESLQTETVKQNMATESECVQTEIGRTSVNLSISELALDQAGQKLTHTEEKVLTTESAQIDMKLQSKSHSLENRSGENSKSQNVDIDSSNLISKIDSIEPNKTQFRNEKTIEESLKSDKCSTDGSLNVSKNVIQTENEPNQQNVTADILKTKVLVASSSDKNTNNENPDIDIKVTKTMKSFSDDQNETAVAEKLAKEIFSTSSAETVLKSKQNLDNSEKETSRNVNSAKENSSSKQALSVPNTETTKVDEAMPNADQTPVKRSNEIQASGTDMKQTRKEIPLVIDLDDPSPVAKSQKHIEKTPVKQIRPASGGPKQSPRSTTASPATAKSPKTPGGKQSFIDNLIATGIPIVIPDDEEEDTKETMPKARSNIFKMKVQQEYIQQTPSLKSPVAYGKQAVYKDPSAYNPSQQGAYPHGQVTQMRGVAPRQSESYSAAHQYPSEAYMQPQTQGTVRQFSQQPAAMSPNQTQMIGSSPQRRVMHEQMGSAFPSPTHTVPPSSPRNPNRRVSFSPTSNVYQINPNTPPRSMPQHGFVTPTKTPTTQVMSPRMRAASPNQMAHVRRNIGSPQQGRRVNRPPAVRSQGPIIIDDDPPARPRNDHPTLSRVPTTPQGTTRSRANPVSQTPPKPAITQVKSTTISQPVISQPVKAVPEHIERQADPVLPIITNVTSMAKETDITLPTDNPSTNQQTPILPFAPVVERRVSHTESLPGSFVQQSNERTPVKRARSEDSVVTSLQEEPANKRRNVQESIILPATSAFAPTSSTSSDNEAVSGSDVEYSKTEIISPSKLPPEVVIDIDVDDKSLVRRQLNIEAGQITTTATSPLHSPTGSVSSIESESSTGASTPKKGKQRGAVGKTLSCDECGKTFTTKAAVAVHFKTHSDNKAFECDVCGKHFINKGNLKKHIYTHFKEKQNK